MSVIGICLIAFGIAGCGSSSPKATAIAFGSPALTSSGTIPARYTCGGRDTSLPLEWGAVPTGTAELALFMLGVTPNPVTGRSKVAVQWAVAGLNPALHQLASGKLPPGAILGRGSHGAKKYTICPAKHTTKHYLFVLYALPTSLSLQPNFSGLQLLGQISSTTSIKPSAEGEFTAAYARA